MPTQCRVLWAFAALGALVAQPAKAALISFDPSTTTVFEGDVLDVGIRISGLEDDGEIVAGFDLDVLFDGSILAPTAFTFGPDLGPIDPDGLFAGAFFSDGLADLFHSSFEDEETLAALQGGSLLLGHLRFMAVGIGTSALSILDDPLFGSNVVGLQGLSLSVTRGVGSVTVLERPVAVPEPSSFALLLAASLLLLARHKRRTQDSPPLRS